jgi:hypothetical protein
VILTLFCLASNASAGAGDALPRFEVLVPFESMTFRMVCEPGYQPTSPPLFWCSAGRQPRRLATPQPVPGHWHGDRVL